MNAALAAAALGLVGAPFRLHGRDPLTGIDCVGLVAEAMRCAGFRPCAPNGYTMRSARTEKFQTLANANGMILTDENPDIVLAMVNPLQPHLIILTADGFVHAHAGIGRVTFSLGAIPWPVIHRWRIEPTRT